MASDRTKYVLDEDRIPRAWYNIVADLPVPPPAVLHPGTGQPIGPQARRLQDNDVLTLAGVKMGFFEA